eukprot:7352580-Lingulodinium_polyedra.AAC.2
MLRVCEACMKTARATCSRSGSFDQEDAPRMPSAAWVASYTSSSGRKGQVASAQERAHTRADASPESALAWRTPSQTSWRWSLVATCPACKPTNLSWPPSRVAMQTKAHEGRVAGPGHAPSSAVGRPAACSAPLPS